MKKNATFKGVETIKSSGIVEKGGGAAKKIRDFRVKASFIVSMSLLELTIVGLVCIHEENFSGRASSHVSFYSKHESYNCFV